MRTARRLEGRRVPWCSRANLRNSRFIPFYVFWYWFFLLGNFFFVFVNFSSEIQILFRSFDGNSKISWTMIASFSLPKKGFIFIGSHISFNFQHFQLRNSHQKLFFLVNEVDSVANWKTRRINITLNTSPQRIWSI